MERYRCKTCKGTNVEEQVWFNPNTGEVKDNCFNTTYCHDCARTSEGGNVEEIPILDLQIVAAIRTHGPIAHDTSDQNDFQDSVVFLVSRSSGLVDVVRLWIKRPGDAGLPNFTLEYYTHQAGPAADCNDETLALWMSDAHGDWGTLCKGDDPAAIVTAFGRFFVRGMRSTWCLNGKPVDIDEFVAANRDGMPPDELAEVLAMHPGQTFRAGGGAAPEWSITRGDEKGGTCSDCSSCRLARKSVDSFGRAVNVWRCHVLSRDLTEPFVLSSFDRSAWDKCEPLTPPDCCPHKGES